jgi:PERQ amino acid-rich with GYF domain-containing protein
MLSLYKSQRESGNWGKHVADAFMTDWSPRDGTSASNGSWGKRDDQKDGSAGPEICWDHGGQVQPLGLIEMNDEEKEVSTF